MNNQQENDENIFIGKVFSLMALAVTESLERFSAWLLAGFGAAFALILSNVESVSRFIPPENIKCGVRLYLIALAAGVLQRWLASGVQAGTKASKEAENMTKGSAININPEKLLSEIERVTFYPHKWLVRYQFNKVRTGDLASSGRMQAKMAQIQGFLVLAQATLVISSIVVMINGLSA